MDGAIAEAIGITETTITDANYTTCAATTGTATATADMTSGTLHISMNCPCTAYDAIVLAYIILIDTESLPTYQQHTSKYISCTIYFLRYVSLSF
jgi:hypothetical protein